MATRTVRLDRESEKLLRQIRELTGLPISEALKRGLHSFRKDLRIEAPKSAYEIYRSIDLGPGGSAIAPSTEVKRAVKEAIRKKLGR